jgi:hypothetical protein
MKIITSNSKRMEIIFYSLRNRFFGINYMILSDYNINLIYAENLNYKRIVNKDVG